MISKSPPSSAEPEEIWQEIELATQHLSLISETEIPKEELASGIDKIHPVGPTEGSW